jgi:hypothetical protein
MLYFVLRGVACFPGSRAAFPELRRPAVPMLFFWERAAWLL